VVVVSYSGKEINAKLVYYGAGLSGKTTNLESIYEAVPDTSRGKMVSMKTQSDRTLFFDLLPLDLGEIMGFRTRFLLYTVPGQVFYNATRKLVLKGADAIVFVADSEVGKMEENKESIENLRANLAEYKINLDDVPWVIQYNKRDLPNLYTCDELNAELNPGARVPFFEAVATQGKGVFETFRGISHLLMEKVTKDLRQRPRRSRRLRRSPRLDPWNRCAGRPQRARPPNRGSSTTGARSILQAKPRWPSRTSPRRCRGRPISWSSARCQRRRRPSRSTSCTARTARSPHDPPHLGVRPSSKTCHPRAPRRPSRGSSPPWMPTARRPPWWFR